MIDAHCHLDLYPDSAIVADTIRRCQLRVLAVTTTPRAYAGNVSRFGGHTGVRIAVGLHPELVAERYSEAGQLCSMIQHVRYVGEVGLDGSPQHRRSLGVQVEVLRSVFAACAAAGGRLVSLHSRWAVTDVLDLIEHCPGLGLPILHWFAGDTRQLQRAIELGCWFSVGPGAVLGGKAMRLVERMPKGSVLTETDGPFVKIGQRSILPGELGDSVQTIARLWREEVGVVEARLEDNFSSLLAWADARPIRSSPR